jgi:prophage regulatory protein
MQYPDRVVRDDEAYKITGVKRSLRRELEKRGEFPRRRKITERIFGYSERELLEWANARLHGNNKQIA